MQRTTVWFSLLCVVMLGSLALGAEHQYSTGKIIAVEHKAREKVDLYLVNTPVTSQVPYFEITVRLANTDYVAEMTPRHADAELPSNWVAGADVSVRLEKHYLFLKRSDGSELQWLVVKRVRVSDSDKDR